MHWLALIALIALYWKYPEMALLHLVSTDWGRLTAEMIKIFHGISSKSD